MPSTLAKNILTGLPFAAVRFTVTWTAFALLVALPVSAVKVLFVEFQVPSTTAEAGKVTARPLAVFKFRTGSRIGHRRPREQPDGGCHGRRIGDGLGLGLDDAQVADVDGEGDHGHQEDHHEGHKDGDGPAPGIRVRIVCDIEADLSC